MVSKRTGNDYKHVKVQDFGAPPVEELNQVVNYIDIEIQPGKPVIVHCNGGSGRTGTVLAAYLMKKEGLTAEQAAQKVKDIMLWEDHKTPKTIGYIKGIQKIFDSQKLASYLDWRTGRQFSSI